MAKSLWDGYDDEGREPEKAKKPRGPRPNKKWWQEEDDTRERSGGLFGFHSQWADAADAGTDDEFIGFEYGGSVSYGDGSDTAFDDSDSRWYRRNSFRYGKQADYSPSSLFRSTFSSRSYTSYLGNDVSTEAQNKAVRALRNLTRSANTIVDKTTGKRTDYAVQFSTGSDSNGVTDALNDEKQRVVYVSPDELLATKTTEDEDSIVDALTGFVLLRVQLSQDVAPNVINSINATGIRNSCFRAAELMVEHKQKLSDLNPEKFAAATTDHYLAGLLTKSLLTRLSRRKVVANWGGFAPYFIRHAKKFAKVKENLEAAELSVETIVGKLGYRRLGGVPIVWTILVKVRRPQKKHESKKK